MKIISPLCKIVVFKPIARVFQTCQKSESDVSELNMFVTCLGRPTHKFIMANRWKDDRELILMYQPTFAGNNTNN